MLHTLQVTWSENPLLLMEPESLLPRLQDPALGTMVIQVKALDSLKLFL
jgi:hypothetical protein